MVLDLISASYIGWPNPAFVIRSFDTARVVQGERKGGARRTQSRARSSYAEPQPTLAEHFPNALQRYNIFRAIPNFGHRFGAVFSTKSLN